MKKYTDSTSYLIGCYKATIRIATANIKALRKEARGLKENISDFSSDIPGVKVWSKRLDQKNAEIAELKSDIKSAEKKLAELEAVELIEEYAVTSEAQDAAIEAEIANAAVANTESESVTAEIEESAPAKEENEMTTTKATTVITDAELTTKAAVAIDEAPTSEKATTSDLRYIPCKGFSVNGDIFTSFKRGIEDWLENVICYDARAQLLVATRKQLIGIDGKPVRGNYSADRIIVKFNFDSHNDFRGDVKGDNRSIKVAPSEEYFDPEYEAQCKEIVTNWLDKNAGEYRKYQMRMEAKRRADKYYTENPDWHHNGNRVPNSQREAIREYLEQLHAADEPAELTEQAESQIDSDATIATLGGLLVTALAALYNATHDTAPAKEEPSTKSTCYVVRLYGYDAGFPSDPLYNKGNVRFDNLGEAVKYALDDRKAREANEHFGGSMIDKDFDDGNVAGLMTVMSIMRSGKIETYTPEARQLIGKLAGTGEETGAVELKISGVITESNVTFATQQFAPADSQAGGAIDSEAPATEATIFLQPTSDEAAVKDLSDTVLDLKVSTDEIEELLAGGYTLGDSGRASIAKAQALMKQALAELAKLKSIDAAA